MRRCRESALGLACCYACLAVAALAPATCAAAEARNVVLVVFDDLGLQLGCYGNTEIRTPHLDAFAAEATRFDHAFCTTASCSASRSVILTGLHNHANGQYGLAHAEHNFHSLAGVRGLPVLLSEAGYRTCSIGKVHVLPQESYRFDEYLNDGTQGGRNAVRMAELAGEFFAREDDRPFFLYYCPFDPHRARQGFGNEAEYPGVTPVTYDPAALRPPPYLPDNDEARNELAEYYQSISRADQGFGRLLAALRASGHADDTLVVALSDNGPPFPGAKTTLYEPGVRLPLLVRSPAQSTHGQTCQALVTWADITPSVLDYAGVAPPRPLHGRSILPLLDQTAPEGWDEAYFSHSFHEVTMYYPMRCLRTRRYKYILNLAHPLEYPFASDLFESPTWQGVLRRGDERYGQRTVAAFLQRPRHELYDLESDPDEICNLADDPAHGEALQDLQALLRRWQERTADPWLVKYERE